VGPVLQDMNEISCKDEAIELSLGKARASIINTDISFNTRLYNGMFPGPVIRMKAGTRCSVLLKNELDGERCPSGHHNGLHCPDTTNLHTHGLHVTPKGASDNINITVQPGEQFQYQYDLQADTLMGTHWYHPHFHGSTTLQVVGGAFGMLLVDPADDYNLPSDLRALYAKARLIAFNDFDFRDEPLAYVAYTKSWPAIAYSYKNVTIDPNVTMGATTSPHFVGVNGQFRPYFTVEQGEVFVLRMLMASGTRPLELVQTSGPKCEMKLLARDGVFHQTPYIDMPYVPFLQGGRADVAFRCAGAGLVTFSAAPQPDGDMYFNGPVTNERLVQGNVFQIVVTANASRLDAFPASEAPVPMYLQDLLSETPARAFDVELAGVTLLVKGYGMNISADLGVNEEPWHGWEDPHWTERLCKNQLYRIRLVGGHPYHQHINHFQIHTTQAPPHLVRVGEFRDVTLGGMHTSKDPLEVVYMKTWDYDGVYILHCHIVRRGLAAAAEEERERKGKGRILRPKATR
jgi:FtsP/CotA-like multicopper oxidase with cupredoxin domain